VLARRGGSGFADAFTSVTVRTFRQRRRAVCGWPEPDGPAARAPRAWDSTPSAGDMNGLPHQSAGPATRVTARRRLPPRRERRSGRALRGGAESSRRRFSAMNSTGCVTLQRRFDMRAWGSTSQSAAPHASSAPATRRTEVGWSPIPPPPIRDGRIDVAQPPLVPVSGRCDRGTSRPSTGEPSGVPTFQSRPEVVARCFT
jgi:hypothetical protein